MNVMKFLGTSLFVGMLMLPSAALANTQQDTCSPVELTVYFSPDQFELNEAAEDVLARSVEDQSNCGFGKVELYHPSNSDDVLSLSRAEAVLSFLEAEMAMAVAPVKMVKTFAKEGALGIEKRKVEVRILPAGDLA